MGNIIDFKSRPKLHVRKWEAPLHQNLILGSGIDVIKMPESHLACPNCSCPFWEVQTTQTSHKIECGCMRCGWETKLLLPSDLDISRLGNGRFTCTKHARAGMVIIKNIDVLSIGCQMCKTEVDLKLKTSNLIVSA